MWKSPSYLALLSLFCIDSAWGIQILAQTRDPACNPIPVNDGKEVVLKVVTDMSWDNCFWYHTNSADTFNEKEIVCKQFHTDTGLTHPCLNVTLKSSSLSGGAVAENKTCELHILDLDATDTGFWNVEVSLNGAKDRDSFELEPMIATNVSIQDTSNTTTDNGISFTCSALGGVPKANKFEWLIESKDNFFYEWQAILYPIENADNVVTQRLNLASPPSDGGSYNVECISYQTFQDATIQQTTNLTFQVSSSNSGGITKLSTGAIIGIAVPCGLILILIIIVVIACLCGCCCFKSKDEKAKAKAKGKDVPDQQATKTNANQPIPLNQQNIEIRPDVVTTQVENSNQRYNYEPRRDYYYNNEGYRGPHFSSRPAPKPPTVVSEDDGVLV